MIYYPNIFAAVDQSREDGRLSNAVSDAPVRYEASRTQAGLLDKITSGGKRETGNFKNGEFVAIK